MVQKTDAGVRLAELKIHFYSNNLKSILASGDVGNPVHGVYSCCEAQLDWSLWQDNLVSNGSAFIYWNARNYVQC